MIKKYEFCVGTGFVGSDKSEIVKFEFDDNMTEKEIENEVQQEFETWVWENIDAGFDEVE